MNKVILIGRLTKDPEFKELQTTSVAKYTLAVDRSRKDDGAYFIPCTAFGKCADFAAQYLHKGTKIAVTGRIQTGSYDGKDGKKVYTTDVIVDGQEFVESKKAEAQTPPAGGSLAEFMTAPDFGEELPFV